MIRPSQVEARRRYVESTRVAPRSEYTRPPLDAEAMIAYLRTWDRPTMATRAARMLSRPIGEVLAVLHAAREQGTVRFIEGQGWALTEWSR